MSRPRFSLADAPPAGPPLIEVYQVSPAAIQFFTAIMEAADGVGLVRTLDEARGIIECWIMPDFQVEFRQILAGVARRFPLQYLGPEFD